MLRGGLLWCGRGEAAGDRTATTEPSRASTIVDHGPGCAAGYGSYDRIGAICGHSWPFRGHLWLALNEESLPP